MLYANLLEINDSQEKEALDYLRREYDHERIDYPCKDLPGFDPSAALWAARTIYTAAQLLLYRENRESDLQLLFPDYPGEISSDAQLSADLVLRFLPDMIVQLKLIDPEDALIPILEKHLMQWHYSGIKYTLRPESLDFSTVISNTCLEQLYIDRVNTYKKISLAKHPALDKGLKASLGIFADVFWKDFDQTLFSEYGSSS